MILLSDLGQAFGNLRAQKTRTFLTAIGIVFGVGSVIGMMATPRRARERVVALHRTTGVRNILIDSRQAMTQEELQQRRRSSPGLSERDVRILQANIDAVELLSARRTLHPSAALPKPSLRRARAVRRPPVLQRDPQPAIRLRDGFSIIPTTNAAPWCACSERAPR